MFQVTGRDYRAGTVGIQSFEGDVNEIDVGGLDDLAAQLCRAAGGLDGTGR